MDRVKNIDGGLNQDVCLANGQRNPFPSGKTAKTGLLAEPLTNRTHFNIFALHVTGQQRGVGLAKVSCFPYRQVGIVTVTMVHSSYDTGPPRPAVYVADFWRLVPADTEEPLPDQLRSSLDCHGPSAGPKTPPLEKTSQPTAPSKPRYLRHLTSSVGGSPT